MPEITDPNALAELNGAAPAQPTQGGRGSVRRIYTAPQAQPALQRPADAQATDLRNTRTAQEIAANPSSVANAEADLARKNREAGFANLTEANKLRDDYRQQVGVKNYESAIASYGSALNRKATPEGDLSLIYDYAKIMDPGSVVREGEMAMATGAAPIVDRALARFGKELEGGGTLSPTTRENLKREIATKMAELNRAYLAERVRYKGVAERYGVPPIDVVGDHPGISLQQTEANFLGRPVDQLDYNAQGVTGQVAPQASGGNPTQEGGDQDDVAAKVADGFSLSGGFQPTPDQNRAGLAFLKTNPTPEAFAAFSKEVLGGREVSIEDAKRTVEAFKKGATWGGYSTELPDDENNWLDKAGAVGSGLANGFSAGLIPEAVGMVAGDDVQARMEQNADAIEAENPGYYMGGEIGGMIGGSVALGGLAAKGAAKVAPSIAPAITQGGGRVAVARGVTNETAFGAISGAGNAEEGERLDGAKEGALWAAGGKVAGDIVGKGVGRVIAPKGDEGVDLLREKGVRTSIGQSLGPTASRIEESLTSIPLVGSQIQASRARALADFNRAVVDDSLAKIGESLPKGATDTKAMAFAQKAFDRAYDKARSGMSVRVDSQMVTEFQNLKAAADIEFGDDVVARLQKIYDGHLAKPLGTGRMDGQKYKDVSSRLGKLADTAKRADNPELFDGLMSMKAIVDDAARRSSSPEAAAALDAADEGYALFVRAENAAKSRGGETGMFTPSQYDAAVQRGDSSVRSKAYLRGDALGQDMAEAGKTVLRDKVANSGTPERAATGALLAGSTYVTPWTAAPLAVLSAAYAPGVRDAISKAVTRKATAQQSKLADFIRERVAGKVGAAAALERYTAQ